MRCSDKTRFVSHAHPPVEGTLRGTVRFRPSLAAATKVLRQLQGRPVPAENGPAIIDIGNHGRTVLVERCGVNPHHDRRASLKLILCTSRSTFSNAVEPLPQSWGVRTRPCILLFLALWCSIFVRRWTGRGVVTGRVSRGTGYVPRR